jgi:hypothetical protein
MMDLIDYFVAHLCSARAEVGGMQKLVACVNCMAKR